MKIIILGAGQVGGTLAENLVREENDITIVDTDTKRLRELQDRLDIQTIIGPASHPDVLQRAGADDADMIICVTSNDETNMVACQIAYSLFQTPTKIARIRSTSYLANQQLFSNEAFPIDVCISPEQLVTNYVSRLIEHPGALQVLDFAEGKVRLVAVKPIHGGPLVGRTVKELHEFLPEIDFRLAAIYRENSSIPVTDSTVIEVGDEIFFIAASQHIKKIMAALRRLDKPYKRIMIAGGGHIGMRLAGALEDKYQVKIVEHNVKRSSFIAEHLNKTIVLEGDAQDKELLVDENIERIDVFCAVTNDDEVNIMSALQAKRLGARTVMALSTRTAYVDLIEGGDVDIAISPQLRSTSAILTYIRRGDIVNVHSLRRGAAEAMEVIAHGDKKTSKVVGVKISNIKLPSGVQIGAIVRGEKVLIGNDDLVIESEDHVILFLDDKKRIHDVERLFQVSVSYF